MVFLALPRWSASLRRILLGLALLGGSLTRADDAATATEATSPENDDVTVLPELEVKGVRVEDFGFRLNVTIQIPGRDTVQVVEVFPNTAASKAGLRPGDLVTKIDGKTPSVWSLAFKPNKLQERKWAELAAGKKTATLTMLVRSPEAKELRTVTMVIPSPPPRFGSKMWSAPEGRPPAQVPEAGPLAALAREVLDNGIWTFTGYAKRDGVQVPLFGYGWRIVEPAGTRRIMVTQQNGKTEITLTRRWAKTGQSWFTTSPSGAMDRGGGTTPKKKDEKRRAFTDDEVRAEFAAEVDFWLHKVGRVTGRWPFEVLPSTAAANTGTAEATATARTNRAPRAESFLELPAATAAQRELFLEALGKVGADAECWAYTETSRGLDGDHATTVRVDPSRPPEEHTRLLKIDGKAPKPAQEEKWRSEGRAALPGLAELPPLSSLVDTSDVRVVADEAAATVFELPVQASNAEFPADKFQARFRVNKTHRGFEDFAVKLREALGVAGLAKVTDAGLEAQFRVIEPQLAPQPVRLRIGGGVRVLLVKISRAVEITRTEFQRVTPYSEPEAKPAGQ